MDKLYKVFYLDVEHSNYGLTAEALSTSQNLEALLLEQSEKGYILDNIVRITGNIGSNLNGTVGLIVTLRRKE